jgi:ankyrin repeat protein
VQVLATRAKGETVGEVSFFFRMRHIYTAMVGKATAMLFVLSYDDFKQLAATYVDDHSTLMEALVSLSEANSNPARSAKSAQTIDSMASDGEARVRKRVEDAMKRRAEQHIVKFLDAVHRKDMKVLHDMLETGKVDVDESDYDFRTALHIAASNGHKAVLRCLIEIYSASHNVYDRHNGSPLDDAIRERHVDIVRYLAQFQHGNMPAQHGEQLIQAAADDDTTLAEVLLVAGVDPNHTDSDHRTALHVAAANNSMKVCTMPCPCPPGLEAPLWRHAGLPSHV